MGMKYAYQASQELGILTELGSLMRAIGKGWRLVIIATELTQHHALFKQIQGLLLDPDQLQWFVTADFSSDFDAKKVLTQQLFICLDGPSWRLAEDQLGGEPARAGHWMVIDAAATDREAEYDLISDFKRSELSKGPLTAIVGTGKGKTSTALGIALQAVSEGKKASVIQWFKEKKQGDLTWAINEHQFEHFIKEPDKLEFHPMGLGFFGSPKFDRVSGNEAYQYHRERAYQGLQLAREKISSAEYAVVVLDECIDTVSEIAQNIDRSLIDLVDLQKFLNEVVAVAEKNGTHLVVTGRRVTSDWQKWISSHIEVTEIKHPWKTKRQGAISGLDF